ncbi:hypothetical protein CDL15_Pgr000027 [Punica granatum]|uniref:Uncharacterized protein n=1 Tax=Punica granatum TaxID=22663 RepID=A0A218VQV7_PUNGR|nr:hypothetical protein CDL15_Pgr000027 [Punica granatum]
MFLSSEEFEFDTKTAFFFVLIPLLSLDYAAHMSSVILDCDGLHAFSPPPTPAPLPEDPLTPPEAPPVPQPVIPQLEVPLIGDTSRIRVLYDRYLFLNFGGDDNLRRMVDMIDVQFIVERHIEAALVDDGYSPNSIIAEYRSIRGLIHSPRGRLMTQTTYNSYLTQIMREGTRESVPYRRVITAIRRLYLSFER